ncbi:MAG: class I SAM-dependent methyltransferase [Thermonemataceae bacterium]|mgnify:CR=1 FL=1
MEVKQHYDQHLANIYTWMLGDLASKSEGFRSFLVENGVKPINTGIAIDLGAGNGLQSIALKHLGFQVTAVDFNQQLLNELKANSNSNGISTELNDIRNVSKFDALHPELIICCGDTLTHLDSKNQIKKLLKDALQILEEKGSLILAFRDYSKELDDHQRFIPVKSTQNRILTCILEYEPEKVKVSDLLYEKEEGEWRQKVSSYRKVRIAPSEIVEYLKELGMKIKLDTSIFQMHTIIAEKVHN